MPRLFSSRHIISVLQKHGFVYISQRGSHVKFRQENQGVVLTVIVPAQRKEIPFGTFRSIVRQSGLTDDDFEKR